MQVNIHRALHFLVYAVVAYIVGSQFKSLPNYAPLIPVYPIFIPDYASFGTGQFGLSNRL